MEGVGLPAQRIGESVSPPLDFLLIFTFEIDSDLLKSWRDHGFRDYKGELDNPIKKAFNPNVIFLFINFFYYQITLPRSKSQCQEVVPQL